MKNVMACGYAKINLFLDVIGIENGFHMLDTVVVTLALKDRVEISARKDNMIVLRRTGSIPLNISNVEDNAYKAAKLFQSVFKTAGVNITVEKNIPVGSGMGGSSADISAVLKGMKELFEIKCDIKQLADSLSSDAGYQLSGGYARLGGKGDKVVPLDIDKKLYMLIGVAEGGVNTSECFFEFDRHPAPIIKNGANRLITALTQDNYDKTMFYNALFKSACKLNNAVLELYSEMQSINPRAISMSGSGGGVFSIYNDRNECETAKAKLADKYPNLITTETFSGDD